MAEAHAGEFKEPNSTSVEAFALVRLGAAFEGILGGFCDSGDCRGCAVLAVGAAGRCPDRRGDFQAGAGGARPSVV